MIVFWSVINCIFVHWTKKLTLVVTVEIRDGECSQGPIEKYMTLPSSLAPPLHLFLLWTRWSKTLNTYLIDTILFNYLTSHLMQKLSKNSYMVTNTYFDYNWVCSKVCSWFIFSLATYIGIPIPLPLAHLFVTGHHKWERTDAASASIYSYPRDWNSAV